MLARSLLLYLSVTLLLMSPASACPNLYAIFCDDFSAGPLNTKNWQLGTWKLGRTLLGNSPLFTSETNPDKSTTQFARLRFDTYQFKGTEIWSVPTFSLSKARGFSFKARVRQGPLPSGLVTSFFTYNYDNIKKSADEIDIEVLTKSLSNTETNNQMQLTTWNDWTITSSYTDNQRYYSQIITAPFKVGNWHTYEMRWKAGKVEWFLDGNVTALATSTNAVPDMDTYIRLNFWAPDSSWTAAYNSALKPAPTASKNTTYYYDVDWVEVSTLP